MVLAMLDMLAAAFLAFCVIHVPDGGRAGRMLMTMLSILLVASSLIIGGLP